MPITFTKMQGLGNDFVVLDTIAQSVELTPGMIRQMADRHFGIGCDQLLVVETAKRPDVDFEYRIFNADGSEVAQCGNGARCVGRYLWDSRLTEKKTILLGTKERIIAVRSATHNEVTVNMGVPLLEPGAIPFEAATYSDWYSVELQKETIQIGVVNLGNPHAVMLVNDVDQAPVTTIGAQLERHPRFPERVNVGFMQCLGKRHIRLRVFERGVGETLACGSGACAAVVIGHVHGLLDDEVQVDLLGGTLKVSWTGLFNPVWMTGPAEEVFRGEWLKRSC
ncbi:MAG TPA: diaminopimelate epimerase [Gammaproteobacteria bacterium]|nr:diaminopimelate epimerase [Gammaproteobacteria bacterium]